MFSESPSVRNVLQFPKKDLKEEEKKKKRDEQIQTTQHVIYKQEKKKKSTREKLYSNIRVATHIARFINNIKTQSYLSEPDFNDEELPYISSQKREKTQAIFKYENKVLFIFHLISGLFFIFELWETSFELALGKLADGVYVDYFALLACIFMIFLNNNSETKNQQMGIIREKTKIRQKYLGSLFIPDILVIIGFILKITPLDENYTFVFYVSRILLLAISIHISDVWDKIQQKLTLDRLKERRLLIMKLMMKVFLFLHCVSIFLILFAKMEKVNGIQTTWIQFNGFAGVKNYELYIYAWYWTCTFMSTVGFGDINPAQKNPAEALLISILQILCCIFFSYFMNSVGELLKIFGEEKVAYQNDIRKLDRYLRKLRIDQKMKDQARTHLYSKYEIMNFFDTIEDDQIREQLTDKLKDKLILSNNLNFLKDSQLTKYFGEEILKQIALNLEKSVYRPESFVFEKQLNDPNLWIIQEGTIRQIVNQKFVNKPVSIYHKRNSIMGWMNFLLGQSFKTWGWTQNFTIAYKINRNFFMRTLKKYTKQMFKFMELKHCLIEKDRKYENSCLGCGQLSHNIINCPRLHFIPRSAKKIINRRQNRKNTNNIRKPTFSRNERKANNCFSTIGKSLNTFYQEKNFSSERSLGNILLGSTLIFSSRFEKKLNSSKQNKKIVDFTSKMRSNKKEMKVGEENNSPNIVTCQTINDNDSVIEESLNKETIALDSFISEYSEYYRPRFSIQSVLENMPKKRRF